METSEVEKALAKHWEECKKKCRQANKGEDVTAQEQAALELLMAGLSRLNFLAFKRDENA